MVKRVYSGGLDSAFLRLLAYFRVAFKKTPARDVMASAVAESALSGVVAPLVGGVMAPTHLQAFGIWGSIIDDLLPA